MTVCWPHLAVFVNKVLVQNSQILCLHIVYNCFHGTTAEWGSVEILRYDPRRSKYLLSDLFQESFLTSVLYH